MSFMTLKKKSASKCLIPGLFLCYGVSSKNGLTQVLFGIVKFNCSKWPS